MIFHCVYQTRTPRYILSNNASVMKHHLKNSYPEVHKPEGIFHILDPSHTKIFEECYS